MLLNKPFLMYLMVTMELFSRMDKLVVVKRLLWLEIIIKMIIQKEESFQEQCKFFKFLLINLKK